MEIRAGEPDSDESSKRRHGDGWCGSDRAGSGGSEGAGGAVDEGADGAGGEGGGCAGHCWKTRKIEALITKSKDNGEMFWSRTMPLGLSLSYTLVHDYNLRIKSRSHGINLTDFTIPNITGMIAT